MKRILMIADDIERWGPARLPEPLSQSGFEIAVLCAAENPLNHSSFVTRRYTLEKLKSWRAFGTTLGRAMADWTPDLIVPCDELAVVMLHYFVKRPRLTRRYLTAEQAAVLRRSIGRPEIVDAMVLKHQTRILAESLGVSVPRATVVKSISAARRAAAQIGYPVFLKSSFSWAGEGTVLCRDQGQLDKTFGALAGSPSQVRNLLRRVLARDWYHASSTVEVQQAIAGESAMYNVAALEGRVLAGFFAERCARMGTTGPSTTVSISENKECREMAEAMIAAMGASGFLAFDFMRCGSTGKMFLLECNPRPNQICHLGRKVGVDLCQALADGMSGTAIVANKSAGQSTVPLFPQVWMRDENAAHDIAQTLDVPENDRALFQFMLRSGENRGCSSRPLLEALKTHNALPAGYTFG